MSKLLSSVKTQTLQIVLTLLFISMIQVVARAQFGTSPWTAPSGTYTIPAGVTSITVECWGGGGGGGGAKSSSGGDAAGGGGGGGAYSSTTVSLTPGQSIIINVGSGGTAGANNGSNGGNGGASSITYNSSVIAQASGGNLGNGSTNGAKTGGAGGSTGIGTIHGGGSGGNGYIGGSFDFGGGGGGAGGTTTNGGNGTTSTGSPVVPPPGGPGGTAGGGNGGNGYQGLGGSGSVGAAPGGGGGGAAGYNGASGSGGAGGAGKIIITYTTCVPATPGSITGSASICSGSANTYSIASVGGATSYTWSLPNGWTGTSTTESINTTASSTGGTISVTANNSCGSSAAQTLAVNIISAPATPGAITGSSTICTNSTNTYSISTVSGATSYTWTLPNGWTGTSATTSINATADATGGTILVTANNNCSSSGAQTLTVATTTVPSTPGIISGSTNVCNASVNTYTIASVNGATSYTWTLPNGWTGLSTTTSISPTSGSTGGDITVIANNSCGSSSPQTLTIGVIPALGTPGTINGPDSLCNGSSGLFTIAPVSGATSYTWTVPNGWSGSSLTDTLNGTAGATGGNVMVVANNSCGSSTSQTHPVIISSNAPALGGINGSNNVCSGSATTYSVVDVGAVSYTWTLPNGWTGSSNTNSITATAGSIGGVVSVVANSTCSSSSSQNLSVSITSAPSTPGTISGLDSVCNGTSGSYSVATVNGATAYTWTLPGGWSGSSTTETISAIVGSNGGTISVTADNACGSSTAQTLPVTANFAPSAPGNITGQDTVCNGTSGSYSVATVSGATGYTWTLPNGWSGSSTAETISPIAGSNGGTISVTADNACGSSTAQTLLVATSSAPGTPGAITGAAAICEGASGSYSVAAVSGATGYTWTLPNSWLGSSIIETISATAGSTGGNITVTADNNCGSSTAQTASVTVNPNPVITFSITPNTICQNALPLALTGSPSGGTYNGQGVTGTNFNPSGLSAGSYTITYTYTDNNSCGASATSNIAVTICSGVDNVSAWDAVKVYPNPSESRNWNIECGADLIGSQMEIYDDNGRLVYKTEIQSRNFEIELNTTQGVYLMRIDSPKYNISKKLIKL